MGGEWRQEIGAGTALGGVKVTGVQLVEGVIWTAVVGFAVVVTSTRGVLGVTTGMPTVDARFAGGVFVRAEGTQTSCKAGWKISEKSSRLDKTIPV